MDTNLTNNQLIAIAILMAAATFLFTTFLLSTQNRRLRKVAQQLSADALKSSSLEEKYSGFFKASLSRATSATIQTLIYSSSKALDRQRLLSAIQVQLFSDKELAKVAVALLSKKNCSPDFRRRPARYPRDLFLSQANSLYPTRLMIAISLLQMEYDRLVNITTKSETTKPGGFRDAEDLMSWFNDHAPLVPIWDTKNDTPTV